MAKKKKTAEKSDGISFEASLAELEKVVADLESGDIGLDESLRRYEQGVKHIRSCRAALDRAEKQIQMLVRIDDEGRAVLAPFSESEGSVSGLADHNDQTGADDEGDVDARLF